MKKLKILFVLIISGISRLAVAQEMPEAVTAALKNDDAAKLTALLTKDNINNCYGNYSMLSEAIRDNAINCFGLLIEKGADVNKSCNGYVPPLMHAAKYGNLEMVKVLIAKGANVNYKYNGTVKVTNGPAQGETALSYATKYDRDDVVDYLNSLPPKQ